MGATSKALNLILKDDFESLGALNAEEEDLDLVDGIGNSPLIWACEAGASTRCVEFLANHQAVDLGRQGFLGNTALQRAVRKGHVELTRVLLEAAMMREGEVVNKDGISKNSSLGAIAFGNIYNDKLQYPMHHASFHQQEKCLGVLLEFGLDTQVQDRKGRTPLEDTKSEAVKAMILKARE